MRLLFVPVSAPRGFGEYARALAIASACAERRPGADIRFVLSREAPYAKDNPFPTTLVPSSPTFHSREVAAVIEEFRPAVVIFDNAGRTAQLAAARRAGARVVYVSSRPRQRYKAFRLRWMRLIDEHWIAWPELMAGSLSAFERLKLRLLSRPRVRYLDTVMPEPGPEESAAALARFALEPGDYVLVVPGGGSAHPGAENAPGIVAAAAAALARRGERVLQIGAAPPAPDARPPSLRHVPRVSMREIVALIRGARLVISNGGDTLLQTLACARPCLAVPIAGDQARRIARCEAAGAVVRAPLEAAEIERRAIALLDDEGKRQALLAGIARLGLRNGMATALDALDELAAAAERLPRASAVQSPAPPAQR